MDSFSDKSEKPTSKRLKKAKEEGRFPYSLKFANSLSLLGTLILMGYFSSSLISFFKKSLIASLSGEFSIDIILSPIKMVAFLILSITCITFVSHGWQNHFFFSFKTFQKRNKTSSHRLYVLLYSVISWILLALLLFQSIHSFDLFSLSALLSAQILFFKKELFLFIFKLTVLFLVLGCIDYLMQRRFFYKEMHMTKQEVKEEFKEEEVTKSRR
jgi:flagellar biosynthetic protein FlhB